MDAQALTLGQAKGGAIVAQPLLLSVPVSAASDEDVSNLCFEADVFYGENKVERTKVSINAEAAVAGKSWQIHISSRLPVDEPVVSVDLRLTCAIKASRRYVLLADVAPELLTTTPVTRLPAAKSALANIGLVPGIGHNFDGAAYAPEGAKRGSVASFKSKSTSITYRHPAAVQLGKSGSAAKARLKLAPLDLSIDRDPALQSTLQLLSMPTEDVQKRSEAAALWRALNISPESMLQETARLKELESSIQELSEAAGRSGVQAETLAHRLARAESERYNNPLVIGLGTLVFLMGGVGLWYVRHQRRMPEGRPWWRGGEVVGSGAQGVEPLTETIQNSSLLPGNDVPFHTSADLAVASRPQPLPPVDIDLELDFDVPSKDGAPQSLDSKESTAKIFQSTRASSLAGLRDFPSSVSGSLRAINSQEMIDTRQQAEFFMTLGQYEDAIDLLRRHLDDAMDVNPLVCLDLLKILHTLSRKEEFDRCRTEFHAVFSGEVPEYSDFSKRGESLLQYPEVCEQLTRLWPSSESLEFLEDCLIRKPNAFAHLPVELGAFKDLLLLHAICSRLVNGLDGIPTAFSVSKLVANNVPANLIGTDAMRMVLPSVNWSSQKLDLDLDVSDWGGASARASAENLIDFDTPELSRAFDRPAT